MSSSELELVHQKKSAFPVSCPIYLVCVFRDESLLLDYFVSYYRSLGVTHFIMVDNLSDDDGVQFLKQLEDINLWVYQAKGSYKDANFGTMWVNGLLEKHCTNQYCFTLDVDELFLFDSSRFDNLNQLIDSMESEGCNAVSTTLLDMYPKETNNGYKKGMDFLSHSSYFDTLNAQYYRPGFYYGVRVHNVGGVRERVFNKTVCILKFPFFKYNFQPLQMAAGYHFFQENGKVIFESEKVKPLKLPCVLMHFKFIKPDLSAFFRRRVELNQDWDNSSEYQSYVDALPGESSLSFYDGGYSRRMESDESLREFFIPIENGDTTPKQDNGVKQEEKAEKLIESSLAALELESGLTNGKEAEKESLTYFQNIGISIFGGVIRVFLTKRQYQKLKRTPHLFFNDSNNDFTRMIGRVLRLC
ncbi:hypothetical protein GQR58_019183 [Nymphon striatum]|nr:hypothetical protein GQR58_019183 [Nymphon striatum]